MATEVRHLTQPSPRSSGGEGAVRWLRNHREIATFLKLTKSAKRLREIGSWIARDDFPKKLKKGFVAAEVYAWYLRFAAEQLKHDGPLLAARQILEQKRVPGRRAVESLANAECGTRNAEVLADRNRTLNIEGREELGPYPTGEIPSQAAMARVLAGHFKRDVHHSKIKDWCAGIKLPRDPKNPSLAAPSFPLRDPGRNGWSRPERCFEWYRTYVYDPSLARGASQQEFFDLEATRGEFTKQELLNNLEEEKLRAERLARERGDLISVNHLDEILLGVHKHIAGRFDRLIEDRYGVRKVVREAVLEIAGKLEVRSQESGAENSNFKVLVSNSFLEALDARLVGALQAANDGLKGDFREELKQSLTTNEED